MAKATSFDPTTVACSIIKALARRNTPIGDLHRSRIAGDPQGAGSWDLIVGVVRELIRLNIIERTGRDGYLKLVRQHRIGA